MRKEIDTNNQIVAEINECIIVRSEAKAFDKWEQKFSGHTKVYYDVCDREGNLLESFKTLREAKSFCA